MINTILEVKGQDDSEHCRNTFRIFLIVIHTENGLDLIYQIKLVQRMKKH